MNGPVYDDSPVFDDGPVFNDDPDAGEDRGRTGIGALLADLASEAGLPAADFHDRVRDRVAARRRRRTAALAAGVAACAAAVLGLALTLSGGGPGAPRQAVGPAAAGSSADGSTGGPGGGSPTPGPTEMPWWPLTDAKLGIPPSSVMDFWNTQPGGPHSDVQSLLQEAVGHQVLFLLTGRDDDGRTRVALVVGDQDGNGELSGTGLILLTDLPGPARPDAPVALAVTSASAPTANGSLTMELLAAPCAGQTLITYGSGSKPTAWETDKSGVFVLSTGKALSAPDLLAASCAADSPSAPAIRLSSGFRVTVATGTVVSLFTEH